MLKYQKGTVILVPFPFSDKLEEKIRPAVIVSNKVNHNQIIIAFITSNSKNRKDNSVVRLNKQDEGFKDTGLKVSSLIYLSQLATINTNRVLGRLGVLSFEKVKEINDGLKKVFGI